MENACSLSLRSIASPRYSHIRPILESGQDATGGIPDGAVDDVGWVRGGDYYAEVVRLAVDNAHSGHMDAKIQRLVKRAGLRYPQADLRTIDLGRNAGSTGA